MVKRFLLKYYARITRQNIEQYKIVSLMLK